MAAKKARVLRDVQISGVTLQPNDVIEADEKALKDYAADGSLDLTPAAIEYCEVELKVKAKKLAKAAAADAPAG